MIASYVVFMDILKPLLARNPALPTSDIVIISCSNPGTIILDKTDNFQYSD